MTGIGPRVTEQRTSRIDALDAPGLDHDFQPAKYRKLLPHTYCSVTFTESARLPFVKKMHRKSFGIGTERNRWVKEFNSK